MFETEAEIQQLQEMLDAHLARANQHMTNIVTPERRLTAQQVVTYLQGTKHVAFATVTSKGEPRVSPLDALFIHGRFTLNTDPAQRRSRTSGATPPAARCTWTAPGSRSR